MDALTDGVKNGSLMKLLGADHDRALCRKFMNIRDKYYKWKKAVKEIGLKVKVGKTK